MYQLIFYIPESHLEEVKSAVFETGAGRYEEYDSCAWQTKGIGQFRPLDGANPYLGSRGTLEKEEEWRVELVVTDELVKPAVEALIAAHPYEEPAYAVIPIRTLADL